MINLRLLRSRLTGSYRVGVRGLSSKGEGGDGDKGGGGGDISDKINDLLKDMMAKKTATPLPSEGELGRDKKIRKQARAAAVKRTPEERLKEAATLVAETLEGDRPQIERELLTKALGDGPSDPIDRDWSNLISGMAVDNETPAARSGLASRSQQVRATFARQRRDRPRGAETDDLVMDIKYRTGQTKPKLEKVDLFGGKPLGIFKKQEPNYGVELKTWKGLEEYDLKLATMHPPRNYFEKMIQWTDQGKIWKFPIDNEQGMEAEQKVHFSEHIFLETHLEGWCPNKGPLRHFMELVCVGLSKNPHYKVRDKIDHIMWFKEYFESKRQLLTEVGAYGKESTIKISS